MRLFPINKKILDNYFWKFNQLIRFQRQKDTDINLVIN